jgi:RimJ/RimL family protein N-acetyltransferase
LRRGDVLLILETERLLLRAPIDDDVDAWAAMLSDPEVTQFLIPSTRPEVAAHIRTVRQRHEIDGFGLLAVVRKKDERVIGRAGLLVWDDGTWSSTTLRDAGENAQVEIGWALARDCWGHGYATEAGAASRDHALETLGRRRVISLIAYGNERSVNVAEKLGLAYERDVLTQHGIVVQLFALED